MTSCGLPRAFAMTLLTLALASSRLSFTVDALSMAPVFNLDLDLPPEQRWDGAVDVILQHFSYNTSFGPVFDKYIKRFSIYPNNTGVLVVRHLQRYFPTHFAETEGIVAALHSRGYPQLTLEDAAMFFYLYELDHIKKNQSHLQRAQFGSGSGSDDIPRAADERSCTGILVLPTLSDDTSGGSIAPIIHGRNMDEDPWAGRNLTLDIRVFRGGREIYRAYDWTWWMGGGFCTGNRVGRVTLELNWRNQAPVTETRTYSAIMRRILDPATIPISVAFRQVLEGDMEFDVALQFFNSSTYASPWYVLMTGTQRRGAVLTLMWNATDNLIQFLNDETVLRDNKTFIVQTNYDFFEPDPADDPRRTAAEAALTMMGPQRSQTELGVWATLSTFPVHNPATFFTLIMRVDRAEALGFVRVGMVPVDGGSTSKGRGG